MCRRIYLAIRNASVFSVSFWLLHQSAASSQRALEFYLIVIAALKHWLYFKLKSSRHDIVIFADIEQYCCTLWKNLGADTCTALLTCIPVCRIIMSLANRVYVYLINWANDPVTVCIDARVNVTADFVCLTSAVCNPAIFAAVLLLTVPLLTLRELHEIKTFYELVCCIWKRRVFLVCLGVYEFLLIRSNTFVDKQNIAFTSLIVCEFTQFLNTYVDWRKLKY